MKITRNPFGYTVSGYTDNGKLVQYSVEKNGHGWAIEKVYGTGIDLNMLYDTKAAAVEAITKQG